LLPTGNASDTIQGVEVTCIDNGMPVVLMQAKDLGQCGYETPEAMEADETLKKRVEDIRLEVGHKMNLGDVAKKTVPKMCLIAPPRHGGAISTRNFIPKRVHKAIGVFGAVSVATACVVDGSVCEGIAVVDKRAKPVRLDVEHPTGFFTVEMEVAQEANGLEVRRAALLRTARKLMDGHVFVPSA
jgi:4-oxalomesaconate tautomerase